MPLTNEQRIATAQLRANLSSLLIPYGTAESVYQRARLPDPARVPAGVTVHVEIAPPSPHPFPILDSSALKKPERVPVYFYALRSDRAVPEVMDTRVIFLIHGGGNVAGHPTDGDPILFYAQLLRAVASRSGDPSKCVLIAPSYRLATVPENAFPAALQDLVAAYDHVLGKGYQPPNITIAGDSAGGNHGRSACSVVNTLTNIGTAVVLTHLVLQSHRPSPRGVVSIAPTAILDYDRPSERAKANSNTDILTLTMLEEFARNYVGDSGFARTDPLVSGGFVPFTTSWPETLILVGSGDALIDSARELAKRLVASDLPVKLIEYDELPHGWWAMSQAFSEVLQDAAQRIARLILELPLASL